MEYPQSMESSQRLMENVLQGIPNVIGAIEEKHFKTHSLVLDHLEKAEF